SSFACPAGAWGRSRSLRPLSTLGTKQSLAYLGAQVTWLRRLLLLAPLTITSATFPQSADAELASSSQVLVMYGGVMRGFTRLEFPVEGIPEEEGGIVEVDEVYWTVDRPTTLAGLSNRGGISPSP